MSWKPIPQEICLANLIEKPLWWYLPRKKFPAISRRYPPQRHKYFGGYPPRRRIFFEDTVWDVRYQTICEGQLSTKQISNGNIFQTNTKGNLYQRVFGKTCLPKKPKEKSLQKKSEEQTLPPKNQTISLPIIISKHPTKETLKRHSLRS